MTAGSDGKSFLAEIDDNVVQLTLNDYDRQELEKLEIKNKPIGLSRADTTQAIPAITELKANIIIYRDCIVTSYPLFCRVGL